MNTSHWCLFAPFLDGSKFDGMLPIYTSREWKNERYSLHVCSISFAMYYRIEAQKKENMVEIIDFDIVNCELLYNNMANVLSS